MQKLTEEEAQELHRTTSDKLVGGASMWNTLEADLMPCLETIALTPFSRKRSFKHHTHTCAHTHTHIHNCTCIVFQM
eukprot:4879005-Pyramimonas_sp.AAC.2